MFATVMIAISILSPPAEAFGDYTQIHSTYFNINDNSEWFYADDENRTVPMDTNNVPFCVYVYLDQDDSYGATFNSYYTDVTVNITLPNATVMEYDMVYLGQQEYEDYFKIQFCSWDYFTLNTTGEYEIEIDYTVYYGGSTQVAESWDNITLYIEGEEEEEETTTGSSTWQWLDAGGLLGILSTIGFFGMIGAPAFFIYASKQPGQSAFVCLVYLIMAEVTFFALFIIGS